MNRREAVTKLNNLYFGYTTEEKMKQKEVYKTILAEELYRFLSGYTYSTDPTPLRSGRIAEVPQPTEVIFI